MPPTILGDGRATMLERRLKALEDEIAKIIEDEAEMKRIRDQLRDTRLKVEEKEL